MSVPDPHLPKLVRETVNGFVCTPDNVRGPDEAAVTAFREVAVDIISVPTDPQAVLDTSGYQALADLMHGGGAIEEMDASAFDDHSCPESAPEMGCGGGNSES